MNSFWHFQELLKLDNEINRFTEDKWFQHLISKFWKFQRNLIEVFVFYFKNNIFTIHSLCIMPFLALSVWEKIPLTVKMYSWVTRKSLFMYSWKTEIFMRNESMKEGEKRCKRKKNKLFITGNCDKFGMFTRNKFVTCNSLHACKSRSPSWIFNPTLALAMASLKKATQEKFHFFVTA